MRPKYLTVLCWVMIVMGVFGLFGAIMMYVGRDTPEMKQALELSPLSLEMQIALSVLGSLVTIIAGIGMLKGGNWARWLYLGFTLAMLGFSWVSIGLSTAMIPSIVFTIAIIGITFLPAANQFLNRGPGAGNA